MRMQQSQEAMSQSREEYRARLNEIFRQVFDDDKIEIFNEMTAENLEEWDSLMHITLIVATEKEFGVRVKAAEVSELENVGALVDLVVERATK